MIGGTTTSSPADSLAASLKLTAVTRDLADSRRNRAVVAFAAVLFVSICVSRLIWLDLEQPIMFLQILPITLIAMRFGRSPGLIAAVIAFGLWLIWETAQPNGLVVLPSVAIRLVGYFGLALAVGWLSDVDRANLRRLAQSERDFRFIAEDSLDMISTHSPNGDYTFVSNSSASLLGLRPAELIGKSAYAFFHPDDVPTVERSHDETLTGVEVVRTTYRLRRADGGYVWVETKSKTNRDDDGNVASIQCITRSVSEDHTIREIAPPRRDDDARSSRTADHDRRSVTRLPADSRPRAG